MTNNEIEDRVNKLLKEELPEIDFSQSEMMATDGLLDSIALTKIIAAIVMEFDAVIPYEDIRRENFNSPKAIAAMVAKYV